MEYDVFGIHGSNDKMSLGCEANHGATDCAAVALAQTTIQVEVETAGEAALSSAAAKIATEKEGREVSAYEEAGEVASSLAAAILPTKRVADAELFASPFNEKHLGAGGNGVFESHHLASVLHAAFKGSKVNGVTSTAIKTFLSAVKAKSDAFKGVCKSKKMDGRDVPFSTIQIAESIAKCTIDTVNNAEELLSWLLEKKVLLKSNLQEAMGALEPPIKFRQADRTEVLIKSIVESMGGRKLASSFQAEVPAGFAADGRGYSSGYSKKSKLEEVGDTSFTVSGEDLEIESKEHVRPSQTSCNQEHKQDAPEEMQLKVKAEPSEMEDQSHISRIGPKRKGGQTTATLKSEEGLAKHVPESRYIPSSSVRHSFDKGIHIDVNFHSTEKRIQLGSRLKIKQLKPEHEHYESANTFADILGPVFHIYIEDGKLESEVDVCFEIPMCEGICARSMRLLKLPAEGDNWEVAGRDSFRRYFADGKVFLNVSTSSFSCWTWGCCEIRAAFLLRRVRSRQAGIDSQKELNLIIYSSAVKFPFPREDLVNCGRMRLDGFGMVTATHESQPDILLKHDAEFKVGFSFQRKDDPDNIQFGLDSDREGGLAKFMHGGHFVFAPRISSEDFEKHRVIHVWIARFVMMGENGQANEGGGGRWQNAYLGSIPLSKVHEGHVWSKNAVIKYFPRDAGTQTTCCYLLGNACRENVPKINPGVDGPSRPPLQFTHSPGMATQFEAKNYCRFCGNSLCAAHAFRPKMFDVDIGELCKKHTDELQDWGRQQQLATEQTDELTGTGKGKAPGYDVAHAQKQEDFVGPRFALTLGNGHYKLGHFHMLPVCRKDAQAMQIQLQELGFLVRKEEDAGKAAFEQAFDEWVENMVKQNTKCVALFHASCHGVEVDNQNYLVPVDATQFDMSSCLHSLEKKCKQCLKDEVKIKCIGLQGLLDELIRRLPVGSLVIFFLDCCRDDPSGSKSLNLKGSIDSKFVPLLLPSHADSGEMTTTFVGYATEASKTADSKVARCNGYSPFTHALQDCLKNVNIASGPIDDLFRSVRALVQNVTCGGMNPDSQSNLTKGFRFLQTSPSRDAAASASAGNGGGGSGNGNRDGAAIKGDGGGGGSRGFGGSSSGANGGGGGGKCNGVGAGNNGGGGGGNGGCGVSSSGGNYEGDRSNFGGGGGGSGSGRGGGGGKSAAATEDADALKGASSDGSSPAKRAKRAVDAALPACHHVTQLASGGAERAVGSHHMDEAAADAETFRGSAHKQRSEDADPNSNPQKRRRSDAVKTVASTAITTVDLTLSDDEDAVGGPSTSSKAPAKPAALNERVKQAEAGWGRLEFSDEKVVFLDPPVGTLYVMGRDSACDHTAVDSWTNLRGISVISSCCSNRYN